MEVGGQIENHKITDEEIQSFLLDVKDNFLDVWSITNTVEEDKNNRRQNKIYLKKSLKEKLWIKNLKHHKIYELSVYIYWIIDNIKFFKNETILNFDIKNFKEKILEIQRLSSISEKTHKKIIDNIEEEIKKWVEDYLNSRLEDKELNKIIGEIESYTWEIKNIKKLKISQTVLQTMWDEHKLLNFVIEVWRKITEKWIENWKRVNINILKNKNWEIERIFPTKAVEGLNWWNKESVIVRKLYDNPDAWVKLDNNEEYKAKEEKFNLEDDNIKKYNKSDSWEESIKINLSKELREEIIEWEEEKKIKEDKKEELNIFVQVTKEWNKVFKRNKEELDKIDLEKIPVKEKNKKKKDIIDKNAQAIADLFADNATLQWTMDFDTSYWMDWIKEYFVHFLASAPTMRFSKINKINFDEKDKLLYVQWDYNFEVNWKNWKRIPKNANFEFYFEYNEKTWKWWIKTLNSTFWKTEDNLTETEEEKKERENK